MVCTQETPGKRSGTQTGHAALATRGPSDPRPPQAQPATGVLASAGTPPRFQPRALQASLLAADLMGSAGPVTGALYMYIQTRQYLQPSNAKYVFLSYRKTVSEVFNLQFRVFMKHFLFLINLFFKVMLHETYHVHSGGTKAVDPFTGSTMYMYTFIERSS